jgi:hypothetical protein
MLGRTSGALRSSSLRLMTTRTCAHPSAGRCRMNLPQKCRAAGGTDFGLSLEPIQKHLSAGMNPDMGTRGTLGPCPFAFPATTHPGASSYWRALRRRRRTRAPSCSRRCLTSSDQLDSQDQASTCRPCKTPMRRGFRPMRRHQGRPRQTGMHPRRSLETRLPPMCWVLAGAGAATRL